MNRKINTEIAEMVESDKKLRDYFNSESAVRFTEEEIDMIRFMVTTHSYTEKIKNFKLQGKDTDRDWDIITSIIHKTRI